MNKPADYTEIPVTIRAMQWTRETTMRELQDFTNNLVRLNDVAEEFFAYDRLHDTWVKFDYGDWIIKGVKGEFYPCVDETFQATYRRAGIQKPQKRPGIVINQAITTPPPGATEPIRQGLRL